MNYHVIAAEYVSGYVIRLKFRDGTAGEIDLSAELTGPIPAPTAAPTSDRFSG